MMNPKYVESCIAGLKLQSKIVRSEEFYNNYREEIVSKHKELSELVSKPLHWPAFSVKKIKLFPGETIQDLLLANAIVLSKNDKEIIEIYHQLSSKKISLASPFFNNLRKKGTRNLASCFILEVEDSLDSIMKTATYCAKISKAGGGAGVNVSKIRAKGSDVAGNAGAASSIMNWVRIIDQVCVSVNQLGVRPGAITVALDIWHSDIEEFLDCQTENGDLRAKAYNIQPQVVIWPEFMEAVIDNTDYSLFCPKALLDNNIEVSTKSNWYVVANKLGLARKTIKARELWKKIQEQQMTVGRPYIFFIDNAQNNTPFPSDIKSSNLCCESYSYFKADEYIHSCNLISVNLSAHENLETIAESASWATILADRSLDISSVDIPEVVNHVRDFRTIGVGLMGLADWLAFNKTFYSDTLFIEETAKTVALACYKTSVELAAKLGACEAYSTLQSDFWERMDLLLPETAKLRAESGIRNSMMTCTAPNTSTSLTMGSTASFLPPYQKQFFDESEDHTLDVIVKYEPDLYLTNFQMNQSFVLNAAQAIQNWTDAGISMEFLFPKGASWASNKAVSDIKVQAWKSGAKAIYYVRTAEPDEESICHMCSN